MQLNIQKSHISGSQAIESFGFTIKADPKAFHLLIAQLYKDRIAAFIRELSTNAYEAHQMLGIENEPFEVTLPSYLNPSFKIRDFGPGLSVEQVAQVYTTIFESTKTNSNDMGGCFGLGSKSPFAYSDNFGVISYNGGMKYCYTVFKNEEGYPMMNLLHQEPSKERTGVEVSIPINRNDYSTVESKAREIYKWFITPPKCVGGRAFDTCRPQTKGSNFGHYDKYVVSGAKARMGNILYTIDQNLCNLHGLSSYPIVVEFPIGSLTPEPSREGLSFDKKTKRAIEEAFGTIKKEFIAKIQPKVDVAEDYYDAVLIGRELIQNSPVTLDELTFGGVKLNDQLGNLPDTIGEAKVVTNDKLKKAYKHYLSIQKECVFILLDKKCAYQQVIKSYLSNKNLHRYKVYICDEIYSKHDKAKFIEFFKIKPERLIPVSAIPYTPPPRQVSNKSNKHLTKMFTWKYSETNAWSWEDVNIDVKTEKGYFVTYFNNKILVEQTINGIVSTKELAPSKLKALMTLIGYTGVVYGVKKDSVEKVVKTGNWTNFLDYAKPLAYNVMKSSSADDAETAAKVIQSFRYERHSPHNFIERLSGSPSFASVKQQDIIDAVNEYKKVSKLSQTDYRSMASIAREFYNESLATIGSTKTLDSGKYKTLLKVVDSKFPLLKEIDSYDASVIKELVTYITLKGI